MTQTFRRLVPVLVPVLVLTATHAALAQAADAMPWSTPLNNLTGFLTGGIAKSISIIAIFVAGVALIFGEDLGGFAKRLLMIVIAVAFITFAGQFLVPLGFPQGN